MELTIDEAYEIYDEFLDYVLTKGWKGKMYAYTETARGEPATGESWVRLELINGFNLKLSCEIFKGEETASIQYWFADEPDKKIEVFYLEQLLNLAS